MMNEKTLQSSDEVKQDLIARLSRLRRKNESVCLTFRGIMKRFSHFRTNSVGYLRTKDSSVGGLANHRRTEVWTYGDKHCQDGAVTLTFEDNPVEGGYCLLSVLFMQDNCQYTYLHEDWSRETN